MCRAFPLLWVEKQRCCTFYNEREKFLHHTINHFIVAEDYEETMESGCEICNSAASGRGISGREKRRGVKFRKKPETVESARDSCYPKKADENDAKQGQRRAF